MSEHFSNYNNLIQNIILLLPTEDFNITWARVEELPNNEKCQFYPSKYYNLNNYHKGSVNRIPFNKNGQRIRKLN